MPTRKPVRAAAVANVGPGAGCSNGKSGIRSVEYPLSSMRRTWASHVGRSVLSGATTPKRSGLVMPGSPLRSGEIICARGQRYGPRIPSRIIGVVGIVDTLLRTLRTLPTSRVVSRAARRQVSGDDVVHATANRR
ncbi:hypothetical protein GCM10012284_59720 [Mangrovihabitans endophyticus]|uniref:Uncharacterized protein n=1 Tax=Mangrovihabitans endophyticus TaxID=1751298 RepID=A0A8J3C4E1_9ACTN|nr:hypothetical protein GCM10012284_59720 [Mangrovihabitans endophyticus]